MRLPGVHVLLTAGVVALTTLGTVSAFSLTGTAAPGPELPPVAPPPAAAAPEVPAPPLPAPPPQAAPRPVVRAEEPAAEPTRAPRAGRADEGAGSGEDFPSGERTRTSEPRRPAPERPGRQRPEERWKKQIEYGCRHGYLDEEYCRN